MTLAAQLKADWPTMSLPGKRLLCEILDVQVAVCGLRSYGPRHPFTGKLGSNSYSTAIDAAVAQVDWWVSLV